MAEVRACDQCGNMTIDYEVWEGPIVNPRTNQNRWDLCLARCVPEVLAHLSLRTLWRKADGE